MWLLWHLIGVWVRGFPILRSRRWFFFCGWPPVVFFFIETTTAFFFWLLFASIIKNRPVRGGFFLQLDLCGPNSKLCRWYRTFFEILLRISAFFALVRCKFRLEFGTLHREHGKMHSVEVVKELWNTRFRQLRTFSCDGGRSARKSFEKDLVLIVLRVRVNYYSFETVRYLVDPASSHMLVLKAKPCMRQYKQLDCEAAAGSLYQCSLMWWSV